METLERELLQLRDEVAHMKDCNAFLDETFYNQIDEIAIDSLFMFIVVCVFFHAPAEIVTYLQPGLEFVIHPFELKSIIKFRIISHSPIVRACFSKICVIDVPVRFIIPSFKLVQEPDEPNDAEEPASLAELSSVPWTIPDARFKQGQLFHSLPYLAIVYKIFVYMT